MNKETLEIRLNAINDSLTQTTNHIAQMQANYNALIGRRDEINYLISQLPEPIIAGEVTLDELEQAV